MHRIAIRWLLPVTCAIAALSAQAQGLPPAPSTADPLDATTVVPSLTHRSSFAAYRRMGDDKPVPWREANETVGRIGGWRAYAREASQPDPAASAPQGDPPAPGAATPPGPTPARRGGHTMH